MRIHGEGFRFAQASGRQDHDGLPRLRVQAAEAVSVLLDLGYLAGQAEFYLNNKKIAALSQQQLGQSGKLQNVRTVRVPIEKGNNLLLCKTVADSGPADASVWTVRAAVITDPEEKRFVPVHTLTPEQVQSLPQLLQGTGWAAAAKVHALDDFESGSPGAWKFQPGPCQYYKVVDSGDAARGKVLRRDMVFEWDKAPALLSRDFNSGTLAPESYGGLRVWLKADQPAFFDMDLDAGNQRFATSLSLGTEWQEFRLPFEEFVKVGAGGTPITADELKKADRLTLRPRIENLHALTIYIDDFGLLKK